MSEMAWFRQLTFNNCSNRSLSLLCPLTVLTPRGSMVLMSLFQIPDSIYIGVTDAVAVSLWYKEKLGLQQVVAPTSDAGDCVSLAFSERDETAIILGPRDSTTDQRPILYATNIEKAKDQLSSRGVSVTPIESDRQGTHYFVMRDMEGNEIEVTEEP